MQAFGCSCPQFTLFSLPDTAVATVPAADSLGAKAPQSHQLDDKTGEGTSKS